MVPDRRPSARRGRSGFAQRRDVPLRHLASCPSHLPPRGHAPKPAPGPQRAPTGLRPRRARIRSPSPAVERELEELRVGFLGTSFLGEGHPIDMIGPSEPLDDLRQPIGVARDHAHPNPSSAQFANDRFRFRMGPMQLGRYDALAKRCDAPSVGAGHPEISQGLHAERVSPRGDLAEGPPRRVLRPRSRTEDGRPVPTSPEVGPRPPAACGWRTWRDGAAGRPGR